MTNDPVAFLHARLNDDAQAARHAYGDHNDDGPEWTEISSGVLSTGSELHPMGDAGITRHIERWDPARALAEVDAKRKLIERGGPFCDGGCDDPETPPMDPATNWTQPLEHHFDCSAHEAAKVLAAIYASHPDYQQGWTP